MSRLKIIKFSHIDKWGRKIFWFSCDCGNITRKSLKDVQSGHTKSCGCLKIETQKKTARKNAKVLVPYQGKLLTYYDLAKLSGVNRRTVELRIERGMSVEEALTTQGQIREKWKLKLGWDKINPIGHCETQA